MEINSYQEIKSHIDSNLRKVAGSLPEGKIQEEIKNTQTAIAAVGLETFGNIISCGGVLKELSIDDWNRMQRELEELFNVKHELGILIEGSNNDERDKTWWTGVYKQKGDNFYWNRYKKYISTFLSPDVVSTIDTDTDIIMNNIENPILDAFDRYGMVVGHVQSGKTGNYAGLICKAADTGYKFIVVIAGGINNLRNQTQERLNESFVGVSFGVQVGAGKGNSPMHLMPISLTTTLNDFNKQDADRSAQAFNFDNNNVPILIVIKKNTKILGDVINWLQKQYKNKISKHSMLLIDDESDYASINTKDEDDPTKINEKIRKLLSLFHCRTYVAYTATPYANIFIDHEAGNENVGKDLFPKDFIYALDTPSDYFGARKIFLDTNDKHIIQINDYTDYLPHNHKIDSDISEIPESLYEAIRVFILNVGIRKLRNQENKHNSMLIHATRFTRIHKRLAYHVSNYLDLLKKEINSYGNLKDPIEQSKEIKKIKETLESRFSEEFEFNWNIILKALTSVAETINVREVHQQTSVPLEYRKDVVSNVIVIGGTSLSRGYTLEGLSVSYFLRNTVYYDTLMQMGRWFGYRPGYQDLCRIFIPEQIKENFRDIIEATEDLFDDFRKLAAANKTPYDFGLAVRQSPNSALQITARNKQKNVKEFIYSMNLDGTSKETSALSSNENIINDNLSTIKSLINKLEFSKKALKIENSYLWIKVSNNIIKEFLNDFKFYTIDPLGIKTRMPIDFIRKYTENRSTDWDIALYSGTGTPIKFENFTISKERRQVIQKVDHYEVKNRQVSSGNAEAISIEAKSERDRVKGNRKETRKILPRPLLMLHILEASTEIATIPFEIGAFGVSFPGDVLSTEETIKLKINTVYYKNLLEELENEEEYDD